jgi:hypothetical protein
MQSFEMLTWPDAFDEYLHSGEVAGDLAVGDLTDAAGFDPNQPRDKDGKWGGGSGSAQLPAAEVAAEVATQARLAAAQTNPLAHPPFLIGADNDFGDRPDGSLKDYVAAYGEEFTAAPLPVDVRPGKPKECFKNASLLVLERPDLTYVEGFATHYGLSILHAWAVTADGTVIDPTWKHPEKSRYFGVQYDREKYLKHLWTAKVYGVLGSSFKNSERAIQTGGRELR